MIKLITKKLEERLKMAEEKAREQYQQKWDIINSLCDKCKKKNLID